MREFKLPVELLAPTKVNKLASAKVLFWDRKVFSSSTEILARFGYAAKSVFDEGDKGFCSEEKQVYADRYGSTSGLAPHGGAGRAAVVDNYYVKGIGPTSLLGFGVDGLHSNGCVWLEEAMREFLFSELAHRILGKRARKIYAVIDTGVDSVIEGVKRRRALVLRGIPLRVSHLQRALMYKPFPMFHLDDVKRVKEARRYAMVSTRTHDMNEFCHRLAPLFGKTIAQCHSRLFFQGGFTSGNVDVDGAIFDFGGARFVPTFLETSYESRGQLFGQELASAYTILASLMNEIGESDEGRYPEGGADQAMGVMLEAYKVEAKRALPWLDLRENETVCQGLTRQGYEPKPEMSKLLHGLSREAVQSQLEEIIEAKVNVGQLFVQLSARLNHKAWLLEKHLVDPGHA